MSKLFGALLIFLLLTACAITLLYSKSEFVNALESKTWDSRVVLTANKKNADKRIKLIDIDQISLDFFENEYSLTWPLPRNTYNHVIDFLTAGKAKGLAFDMLYTESSAQAVDVDREFAESTSGKLPVVTALMLDSVQREVDYTKFKTFSARQLTSKYPASILRNGRQFNSVTLPIIELIEHSSAFGNVQAEPDPDGVFRHYLPGGVVHNIPVLSLPFALYNITDGLPEDFVYEDLIVRLHGGRNTYPSYSLASIVQSQAAINEGLKPEIDPKVFEDSWVILGSTAPGLLDLRPTSLEERGGGLHYVAAILDNIINNNFIKKAPRRYVLVISLFLVFLTLCSTLIGSRLSLHILRVISILLCFLAAAFILTFEGIWIPVVAPIVCILLTAFLGIALQYKIEGRQHRFIRDAFKFYLSPDVVEQIVAQPENLKLGGQKKEVSIFFSDIVGFTSISEKLEPQVLVKMLNEYLSLFAKIIQDSGGTLDKYVGDAVMAFWNAPLACSDHANRAVNAAIACQNILAQNREHFIKQYGVFPDTRIGIHTDEVNVGNFGSKERFNYTVIGDGVNLASRLEGANKNFGTRILISEKTKSQLEQSFEVRAIADLVVLGKSMPIRVYEPIFKPEYDSSLYNQAISALEMTNFELAKSLFLQISNDPVALKYIERIENKPSDNLFLWSLADK